MRHRQRKDSRTKVAGKRQLPGAEVVLMARHEGPTGVGEHGKGEKGSPGTWEVSAFPRVGESDESGTAEPKDN